MLRFLARHTCDLISFNLAFLMRLLGCMLPKEDVWHSVCGMYRYLAQQGWSTVCWGFLFDLPLFPLALLMRVLGWIYPKTDLFESYRTHDGRLRVVLVHGSGSNAYQWLFTGRCYLTRHFDLYTIDLGADANLETYSWQLQQMLYQLYDESREPIALIGCSMGGLVAAHAAEAVSHSVKIATVITIGTPFRGAPALLYTRHLQTVRHAEMTPGSAFLTTLQCTMNEHALHREFTYQCWGGRRDLMVPNEWSFPKGYDAYHRTHDYGHWTPMILPQIWPHIIRHLLHHA